jgi:hypothetical protein
VIRKPTKEADPIAKKRKEYIYPPDLGPYIKTVTVGNIEKFPPKQK